MSTRISMIASSGEEIEIDEAMIVGRGNEAGYIINDAQISRKHAHLLPVEDGLFVEDLASSNGTFLNGEKRESFTAKNNDRIQFYKYEFQVRVYRIGSVAEPTMVYTPDLTVVCAAEAATGFNNPAASQSTPIVKQQMQSGVGEQEEIPPASFEPEIIAEQPWWQPSTTGPEKTRFIDDVPMPTVPKMSWIIKNTGKTEQPRLLGVTGSIAGYCFPLLEGKLIIGRNDQQCNIVIEDDGVSNRHAQIIHQGGVWKLVDLLSSNRTRVNGNRSQTAYLKDGDVITLGPVTLIFQLPDSDPTWLGDEETVPGDLDMGLRITSLDAPDKGYAILASVTGFLALIAAGVYMFV